MKDVIKNIGILLIVIGVVILSIAVFKEATTNTKLAVSLILIVVGFLGHILINRYIE
ncbi:MAG: hypothetical protein K9J30_03715 [Bacteroidales bacterium]|nr:hypothetical protein [Bacteroidales bacterium]